MADTKIVVNCETGEVQEIELTAEEVAARTAEAAAYAAAEAEREAEAQAKETERLLYWLSSASQPMKQSCY